MTPAATSASEPALGPVEPAVRRSAADDLHRGVLPALAGAVVAVAVAALGRWAPRGLLLVAVVPLQVLVALCWLTLTAVPARLAGTALAAGAGAVGAVVLTTRTAPGLGALAGVVGLGVVAAVLGQLLRRDRSAVTDVLAAQCSALLLAAGVAALCAARGAHDGDVAVAVGLAALGLALLVGAVVDAAAVRVWLGPVSAGRSLLGAVLSLGAAAGLGALLRGSDGAVLGLVAAALAVLGDATVAVAAGPRRIARPLAALLPYALVGPGLFVATRVLLG